METTTIGGPSPPATAIQPSQRNRFRQRDFDALNSERVVGSSSDTNNLTKEPQLYRRLDEGVAAALGHGRRWDGRSSSPEPMDEKGSSSIFEKYRDGLVGGRSPSNPVGGRPNSEPAVGHKSLNLRSSVIKDVKDSSSAGRETTASVVSPTKADVNSLLSSDAERFMEYTMSNPPQHQLLQLRVLELFQVWISTPGVSEEITKVLEDARRNAGEEGTPGKDAGVVVEKQPEGDRSGGDGASPLGETAAETGNREANNNSEGAEVERPKSASPSRNTNENKNTDSNSDKKNRSRSPHVVRQPTPPSMSRMEAARVRGNLLDPTPEKVRPQEEEDDALVVALTVESLIKHTEESSRLPSPGKSPYSNKNNPNGEEKGGASYEEIPRFYFPLGKPTTKEKTIADPLYKYHENPHLSLPQEGMTIASTDGSRSSMKLGGASSSISSSNSSGSRGGREKGDDGRSVSRIPPMSTLRFADDRHVANSIKKEFARLHAPSRHQKSRISSRRANSGSKEAQFRTYFHQCFQRICSQCFGVPRYFGFIVIGLIQADLSRSEEHANALTGSVKGGLPFISPQIYTTVTEEHVRQFYERYLKNKDSMRRTFDLLILSSNLIESETEQPQDLNDLSSLRSHLIGEDFKVYLLTLLSHHPGLEFLRQTPDFQTKYLDTVIYRIFYEVDRLDRGRISFPEFSGSPLMDAFRQVDATDDINTVLKFFSYEHFYVLYCRFWELDDDRDMMISAQDLMRYWPDDTTNALVVQRVFSGVGRRVRCTMKNRIGYEDFVWFCLSEEDKSTPTAIRYWFKVLDLDEDGVLSPFEIRTFYDATTSKAVQFFHESSLSFENVICQVFDMLRCPEYRWLKLSDLLAEPVASYVALNMMTNLLRFAVDYEYKAKDPFVLYQERQGRQGGSIEQTPWDRFARVEYDRMAESDE